MIMNMMKAPGAAGHVWVSDYGTSIPTTLPPTTVTTPYWEDLDGFTTATTTPTPTTTPGDDSSPSSCVTGIVIIQFV